MDCTRNFKRLTLQSGVSNSQWYPSSFLGSKMKEISMFSLQKMIFLWYLFESDLKISLAKQFRKL